MYKRFRYGTARWRRGGGRKKKRGGRRGLGSIGRDVRLLKSALEHKNLDINHTVQMNTTGQVVVVNALGTGDLGTTREGMKVTGKRLFIRGTIENNNGTPADGVCRLMIFIRKDVAGILPTMASLLKTVDVNAPRLKNRKHDFVVLYDNTFVFDTTQHSLIPIKINIRIPTKYRNVRYLSTGTSAIITNLLANGLFIGAVGTVAGDTNAPRLVMTTRYDYIDI